MGLPREAAGGAQWAGVPVIVVSAVRRDDPRPQHLEPLAYLLKPVKLAELMAPVERHCRRAP